MRVRKSKIGFKIEINAREKMESEAGVENLGLRAFVRSRSNDGNRMFFRKLKSEVGGRSGDTTSVGGIGGRD